ncbi:MAG: glycosyltransferase [Alphaproteobacteria bacterium]|nr:glycosyltransferase [Alphaproteobacteria bacterium]
MHRVGGGLIERLRGRLGAASHRHQAPEAGKPAGAKRAAPLLPRLAKSVYAATIRRLQWPDYSFHWFPSAAAKARALCRGRAFDALISVSHPFTPHLVALAVRRSFPKLRWLADIGDPFSLLDEIPSNNVALYRRLNRRAEEKVLRSADAVAVTLERCRTDYGAAFPGTLDKIATIPPLLSLPQTEDGAATPALPGSGIHLACIGTLYRAIRDPRPLLALFTALRRIRGDLHLHFFGALHDCGPSFEPFRDEIGRSIHLHGMVPRREIAGVMRAADILVNIGNTTAHQLPSKLVEYVASARPILNLAATATDSTGPFLAGYPSALTIASTAGDPDAATVSAVLAFIAAPPPIDRDAVARFLAPYTISRIADAYRALFASVPAPRLRVLVNAIHARAGGGLTYLRHLLPLLAAEPDLDIHVIPHPSQADAFAALSPALHLHRLAMPEGWAALLAWEQLALPRLARRIGYDILFSPANFGPLAIRAQIIVLQTPLTVRRREARLGKRAYWAALRLMTALSLAVTRRAVAVSRYAAETNSGGALKALPPVIIHHGVAEAFSPPPAQAANAPFLLAVSDLYVQKNLLRLIEAMAAIRRTHPAITLRIAGHAVDAGYAAELQRRVAALGLGDTVLFLGRCDRATLIDLYRSCAVFVFPSTEETFGMPLVEAMACGAPVVAARSAATPEIAGEAALLCDPDDAGDMARAILRVLDDPALRQNLRDRSLERARAFSWPDCARRTAELLREAAG